MGWRVKKTLNVVGWGLNVYSTENYLKLNAMGKRGYQKLNVIGWGFWKKKLPAHPPIVILNGTALSKCSGILKALKQVSRANPWLCSQQTFCGTSLTRRDSKSVTLATM